MISHLWNADDFSTAILMDEFYHQYTEKKQSPPVALSIAKKYLRQVTMGELKKKGWFSPKLYLGLSEERKIELENLERCHERMRPFKSEVYWAGFSCYRCH